MDEKLSWKNWLHKHAACLSATIWVGEKSAYNSWRQCHNGEWIKKLLIKAGVDL